MEDITIPFVYVGQVIEHVDDTVWRGPDSEWGESANLTVRLIMSPNDDPLITPDFWVEVIDDVYGREHEVRASYLAPYLDN